jgi:hypothetical protein
MVGMMVVMDRLDGLDRPNRLPLRLVSGGPIWRSNNGILTIILIDMTAIVSCLGWINQGKVTIHVRVS